jgi:hypothetical protein
MTNFATSFARSPATKRECRNQGRSHGRYARREGSNGAGFRRVELESSTATIPAELIAATAVTKSAMRTVISAFYVTCIRGLPGSENKDTIGIDDVLGDMMLREVWVFYYMHDIQWVMWQLDEDVAGHAKMVFVHGNRKSADPGRKRMEELAQRFTNARLVATCIPEAFGTHHTKIMVLFSGDDTARYARELLPASVY